MERQPPGGIADKEGSCMITTPLMRNCSAEPPFADDANMGVGTTILTSGGHRGDSRFQHAGVLTDATADLAFTLILAVARRVVEGTKGSGRSIHFWRFPVPGPGSIGKTSVSSASAASASVAQRPGFNMQILYHNRRRMEPPKNRRCRSNMPTGFAADQGRFRFPAYPLMEETNISWSRNWPHETTAYLINTSRVPWWTKRRCWRPCRTSRLPERSRCL